MAVRGSAARALAPDGGIVSRISWPLAAPGTCPRGAGLCRVIRTRWARAAWPARQ